MRRSPLGIISLPIALDLVGFGIVLPLLPGFARRPHNATELEVGLLMAMYSLMQFFFAPVWGRLSDRIGRRPVLLLSISGSAVSYLIFAFAPSPAIGLPILVFFLAAVAWSQLEPTAVLLAQESFGFTLPQTGYMFAYLGFVSALIQGGLAGRLAKRLGEPRMVQAGTLLLGIGLL